MNIKTFSNAVKPDGQEIASTRQKFCFWAGLLLRRKWGQTAPLVAARAGETLLQSEEEPQAVRVRRLKRGATRAMNLQQSLFFAELLLAPMGSSYGGDSMTLHDEQPGHSAIGESAIGESAIGDDERAYFSPVDDDERAHYQDGRALWSEGSLWLLRVTGAETGGRTALVEQRMARDTIVPPHRHEREDQSFTVLEGELLFALGEGDDERVVRAGAGDIVWVPRGAPHEFRVESATARVLNAYTPAGIEAMLRAQSVPARTLSIPPSAEPPYARDLSPAAKIALWNRFGMVISPVG